VIPRRSRPCSIACCITPTCSNADLAAGARSSRSICVRTTERRRTHGSRPPAKLPVLRCRQIAGFNCPPRSLDSTICTSRKCQPHRASWCSVATRSARSGISHLQAFERSGDNQFVVRCQVDVADRPVRNRSNDARDEISLMIVVSCALAVSLPALRAALVIPSDAEKRLKRATPREAWNRIRSRALMSTRAESSPELPSRRR
jgi:hypothetical protein